MKKMSLIPLVLFCGILCTVSVFGEETPQEIPNSSESHQMLVEVRNAMEEAEQLQRSAESIFASKRPSAGIQKMEQESWNTLFNLMKMEQQVQPNPQVSSGTRQWNKWCRLEGSPAAMDAASDFASGPADSVQLHNGEIVFQTMDLSAPNRGGIGFSFIRYYHSHLNYNGSLGNSWDHNQNIRILANAQNHSEVTELRLYDGEHEHVFTRSDKTWVPDKGTFLRLEWDENAQHLFVTTPDLIQYDFEPYKSNWRIHKITSRVGNGQNALSYFYNPDSGQLSRIVDPYGNEYLFSYNTKGLLEWVYGNNQLEQYRYDSSDCLISAAKPRIVIGLNQTAELCNMYHWEKVDNHFMIGEVSTKSGQTVTRYVFSGKKVIKAGIYALNEAQKNEWSFQYLQNQTVVLPPAPSAEMQFTYASENTHPSLPVRKEIPARKAVWDYQYNEDGLPTSIHTPDGQIHKIEYNSASSDPMFRGLVTQDSNLGNGRGNGLLSESGTRTRYAACTSLPEEVEYYQKDQAGKETILGCETYVYTENDYLLKESTSFTIPIRYWYNSYGEIAIEQNASGSCTLYFYGTTYPAGNEKVSYADGRVNGAGLCVRTITDANSAEIQNVVRELKDGPCPSENQALPSVNQVTYNLFSLRGEPLAQKVNREIQYSYINQIGNLIFQFSTQNGVSAFSYNQQFECVATFHPLHEDSFFWADKLPGFSSSFYKETFHYNSLGQLVQHVPTNEQFGDKKESPVWKYERTPSGLLLSITNPNGVKRVTHYNPVGQKLKTSLENKEIRVLLSSDYQYSPEGRILSYRDNNNAMVRFEYDDLGNEWKTITSDGVESIIEQDGMGRVVSSWTQQNGQILTKKWTIYGENSRPLKQMELQLYEKESRSVVTEEIQYDSAGRVLASRGLRKDSWTSFLYDGLNRQIAAKDPAGNIEIQCYDEEYLVFFKQLLKNEQSQTTLSSGLLVLYDDSNRVWLQLPVDSKGMMICDQAAISYTDFAGNVFFQKTPGVSETHITLDSLGRKKTQKTVPCSYSFSEENVFTEYAYDMAGNLLFTTTGNNALSVSGTKKNPEIHRVPAPQTMRYEYDALGRECMERQPDGLVIRKKYDDFSLLEQMDWLGRENQLLRSLRFKYDSMQRLIEISDAKQNKVIRVLEYNSIGDMVRAADSAADHEIVVERSYDSCGLMRTEEVFCDGKKFPMKETSSDLELGTQTLKWGNCDISDSYWRTLTLHTDPASRVCDMDLDYRPYCHWKYLGEQFSERTLMESRLSQVRHFNEKKELSRIDIKPLNSDDVVNISMEYSYGKRGEVEFVTSSIRNEKGKKKELTQYYQYDSCTNLVSENNDKFISENPKKRYAEIFEIGTDIVSNFTTQMRFDQAGNVWTNFKGIKKDSDISFEKINLSLSPRYFSSAAIISDPQHLSERELDELASNRCTTIVASPNSGPNGALKASEYRYDDLGCLLEYHGTFTDKQGLQTPVLWQLDYDVFGRLASMNAYEDNEKDPSQAQKGKLVATLNFAYDAMNRRILKEVKESDPYSQLTVTLYERNHPCLVLRSSDNDNWKIVEQYLWGIDSQELLMAVIPENIAEHNLVSTASRYYFHQDRGFSVVASTKAVGKHLSLISSSSYLAFGENSSTAEITSVVSSESMENKEACFDNHLDNADDSTIITGDAGTQFMEIELDKPVDLDSLQIFAEQFPEKFEVYRIPGEEESPTKENISNWIQNAQKQDKTWFIASVDMNFSIRLDCPYTIPLGDYRSKRIVIVWKKTDAPSKISIRELQVNIAAEIPGAIAFAGQWLDRESGLYYHLNRYRLPELNGKFISPDPLGFTDGMNFYAYAHNNPLSWHDPDGKFAHILVGAGVGAVLGGGMYALNCWMYGDEFSWSKLGIATLAGGVSGALVAAAAPLGATLMGAVGGGTNGLIQGTGFALADGESIGNALGAGLFQGGVGMVSGAGAGFVGGKILSRLNSPDKWSSIAWAGNYQPLVRGLTTSVVTGAGAGGAAGMVHGAIVSGYISYEEQGMGYHVLQDSASGAFSGFVHGTAYGAIGGAAGYGIGALGNKIMYSKWGFTKSSQKFIWGKARHQYWKNEGKNGNTSKYTQEDLSRMQRGSAPRAVAENSYEGRSSVELHHAEVSRRSGIPQSMINQKWNLQEVSPREHTAIHRGL